MADSGYYYRQYCSYKSQAEGYEKNIKALKNIKDRLESDFEDEQRNVNKELRDLESDLKEAVHHDSKFYNIASKCETYNEKGTSADAQLSSAVGALEDEISDLNKKKEDAEKNRDTSYKNYESAKQAEKEAREKALKEAMDALLKMGSS